VVVDAVGVAPEILKSYYAKLEKNREQFENKIRNKKYQEAEKILKSK